MISPTRMFYRHKDKDTIFNLCPQHAVNPLLELVTAVEAFPEQFTPKSIKGRKSRVSVHTEDIPETQAPRKGKAALEAEASKGL